MYKKGNKYGRGNSNSGRKAKKIEMELAKEAITQDALISLANSKVYKQLMKIKEENPEAFSKTKEMALPVTLRGITEKREDSIKIVLPKPILNAISRNNGDKENNKTDKTD